MGKRQRRPGRSLSDLILPKQQVNKEFKDNRERFRLFNKMFKEPKTWSLHILTLISVILTVVPLCVPGAIYNATTISFLVAGAVMSIGGEQGANYHYYKYSLLANNRQFDSVKWNIRFNQGMRLISMTGWVLSTFALVMMLFTNDGSISEIW